jgi:uncharacterized SAM-binding protein YcdF (DUF218 family)
LALALVALVALALIVYAMRAPLLTDLAKAWVVNEPIGKADAIVVLGGRPDLRPYEAARLYHAGLAPRILYMDVRPGPGEELGVTISERELTRRILLGNNVPEGALTAIGSHVASTYDETCAVRAWMEKTGAKSIIIPTDLFPSRRTRWIFRHQLAGSSRQAHVEAITPPQYSVFTWWHHEDGVIAFQNEFIKSIYYHLKY